MKLTINILTTLMASTMLIACNNIPTENKESRTDTLTYSIYKAESYSSYRRKKSDMDSTYAIIYYPNFKGLSDTSNINKIIQNELTKEFKGNDLVVEITDAVSAFVMRYDSMVKDDNRYSQYWNREINMRVLYQKYPYVSMSIDFTEYTGGAHGMYGTTYLNFDREKNRLVQLSDLFSTEKIKEITKEVEVIFRKQEGLKENQDYSDYFFEDGKFVLPNNFSIRANGILFHYGLYEIKPYVAGVTEVFLRNETL